MLLRRKEPSGFGGWRNNAAIMVFECIVDAAQFTKLKHMLLKEIDREKDSLRFYLLGDKYKSKVEHYGSKDTIPVEEPLVL